MTDLLLVHVPAARQIYPSANDPAMNHAKIRPATYAPVEPGPAPKKRTAGQVSRSRFVQDTWTRVRERREEGRLSVPGAPLTKPKRKHRKKSPATDQAAKATS